MVASSLSEQASLDTIGSRSGTMNDISGSKGILTSPQNRSINSIDLQGVAMRYGDIPESYGLPSLDAEIESYMDTVNKRYRVLGFRAVVMGLTFSVSVAVVILSILHK